MLSPPCDAVIVHDPGPVRCTVAPEIEHCPAAPNVTANPDVAVALTSKSASVGRLSASGANEIV